MFDDCVSKNVVGDIPFNWRTLAAKSKQFPNRHIRVVVIGTRMSRGAYFGLKIPLDYIFYGDSRVTTWLNLGVILPPPHPVGFPLITQKW